MEDYSCSVSIDYALMTLVNIPTTYYQAVASQDAEKWKAAMQSEIDAI